MSKEPDMVAKALRLLIEALTYPEDIDNRVDMVSGALTYAGLALGEEIDVSDDALIEVFESLAVQTLVAKMDLEGLTVYKLSIQDPDNEGVEVASIVTTTNPLLGSIISQQIDIFLEDRKRDSFEIN